MSYVHGGVGIDGSSAADFLDGWIAPSDSTRADRDDVAVVAQSQNPSVSRARTTERDTVVCWLIGDLYGHDAAGIGRPERYETRPSTVSPASYALSLYERHGAEFVRHVNGNFTLLIHDRPNQEFVVCTDRFGTVPLYWTRTEDETFAFSTSVQALPYHPAVGTAFHPWYLHEYLAFRCAFGVKTPFEGIRKLEPGTVTTISLADGTRTTEQYWRPRYRPREMPFEWFVDEFTRRFRRILDEWVQDDREYGVLLSGGSDSRLVLAGVNGASAFHMNDWMNTEARTAEQVAFAADAEFVLLERGAQYRIDSLERNKCANTFNGWFTQPYTSGFREEFVRRVDGLLSGLYGDSLFGAYSIPSPTISLGRLGSMTLPIERSIETVDDYITLLVEQAHDTLGLSTDLRTVLSENIYREENRIVHHGITYDSLEELVYYGGCYPLSNDDDMRFHTGLGQILPYRSPYLDNRLIDLSLSMPVRYRLRADLVDRAISRLAPELAKIPHANTGVALSRPFPIKFAGRHLKSFCHKHCSKRTPPEPYLTHGPWLDDVELLRSHQFTLDVLDEKRDVADALPDFTAEEIRELYRNHCRGEDRIGELYTLLTVLTMPVTEHVLATETGGTNEKSAPTPDTTLAVGGVVNSD